MSSLAGILSAVTVGLHCSYAFWIVCKGSKWQTLFTLTSFWLLAFVLEQIITMMSFCECVRETEITWMLTSVVKNNCMLCVTDSFLVFFLSLRERERDREPLACDGLWDPWESSDRIKRPWSRRGRSRNMRCADCSVISVTFLSFKPFPSSSFLFFLPFCSFVSNYSHTLVLSA